MLHPMPRKKFIWENMVESIQKETSRAVWLVSVKPIYCVSWLDKELPDEDCPASCPTEK